MNLALKALKFLGALFAKGIVLASAWALSIVLVMTHAKAMDVLSAIGTSIGATSIHGTQKQQAKQTRIAAKEAGKNMSKRTKRILAVNTIGGLTGWFPLLGDAVAMGAMAYEAVLICENSNDFRGLQRTIGMEPDDSFIGTNCEQAQNSWDDTAQWVKDFVIAEVDKEAEEEPRSGALIYRGCPTAHDPYETPPCGAFAPRQYEEALQHWEETLPLYYRIKWEWRQWGEMSDSEEAREELQRSLGFHADAAEEG